LSWDTPLFKIHWTDEDVKNIADVISSGMNWAIGPFVEEFERMIHTYLGTTYAVVFNSGTSALHAALLASEVGISDEVIVPSFGFIAAANAPLYVGAKPVFADIEEETMGLDPEDVKKKIGPNTKAIIPIHYGGCPCRIEELREIAEDHKLILIEDAAEAFGAKLRSKKVGTFGSCGVLSFCQNKIITTGEGGGIVTNSKEVYNKLRLLRSHGRDDTAGEYFNSVGLENYKTLGYNFRMANILAALGVSQLKRADEIIDERRRRAAYYDSTLKCLSGRIAVPKQPMDCLHVYQLYTVRVDANIRSNLQTELSKRGIMTKVYFSPVHLSSFYRSLGHHKEELPVTERVGKEVLSLPMYVSLTNLEIDRIATCVCETVEGVS